MVVARARDAGLHVLLGPPRPEVAMPQAKSMIARLTTLLCDGCSDPLADSVATVPIELCVCACARVRATGCAAISWMRDWPLAAYSIE